MTERNVKLLHHGEFLILERVAHWEFVRRPRSSGAGFIIAVTDARELVLVEQYRYPVDCACIELPAGIIGDAAEFEDESVEASAMRELLEETGYQGQQARCLFSSPTAAGLTSEYSHFVRITGLERIHEGGGVDDENIIVHHVALDGIDDWLEAQLQRGVTVDTRIYAALYWLQREQR